MCEGLHFVDGGKVDGIKNGDGSRDIGRNVQLNGCTIVR